MKNVGMYGKFVVGSCCAGEGSTTSSVPCGGTFPFGKGFGEIATPVYAPVRNDRRSDREALKAMAAELTGQERRDLLRMLVERFGLAAVRGL